MYIYGFTAEQQSRTVAISWSADSTGYSWSIEWKLAHASGPISATTVAEGGGYYHTTTLSEDQLLLALTPHGILSIDNRAVQVRLVTTLQTIPVVTPWITVELVITQSAPAQETALADVVPPCTQTGDIFAGSLPSWMSAARIPGVIIETATPSGNLLLFDAVPEDIAVGMLCYPQDAPTALYRVSAVPYTVTETPESVDGAELTFEALPAGITEGDLCTVAGSTETFSIIDITDLVVTLDHAPDSTGDCTFSTQSVQLNTTINESSTTWCFTTIARRLIEAMARPYARLRETIDRKSTTFDLSRYDVATPWFGHVLALPAEEDTLEIERVSADVANSALALYAADSLESLFSTPLPTYYTSGRTIIFHNLNLIEETDLEVTWEETGPTITITEPIATSLPVYLFSPVYGWQRASQDQFTVDGSTLTFTTVPTTETCTIRYNTYATTAYTAFTHVNVNRVQYLPAAQTLWNIFDDFGLLVGVRRLANEDNATFRERIRAAAAIELDGKQDSAFLWPSILLDSFSALTWNTSESLELPEDTTYVAIPAIRQYAHINDGALLRAESQQRYYFQYDPTEAPLITVDGLLTQRAVSVDTNGRSYITVSQAEWQRRADVRASYRYRQWNVTDGVLSPENNLAEQVVTVYCARGLTIKRFDDAEFRADELIDAVTGLPTQAYRTYAKNIIDMAAITADYAHWGRSLWFEHNDLMPRLVRLPTTWGDV